MRGSKGNGHGNDGKLKPQSMVTDYYGDDIQLELTTYPLIIRICWQIYNYYQKLARILKIIIRLRSQVVTSNEYMHPKRRFWTEHFIQNLLAELKNRLKISIFLWRKSCASR